MYLSEILHGVAERQIALEEARGHMDAQIRHIGPEATRRLVFSYCRALVLRDGDRRANLRRGIALLTAYIAITGDKTIMEETG